MDTTETKTEPKLTPINTTERLIVEAVIVSAAVGTVTVFALAAYGAVAVVKDTKGYLKRRFGNVQNISSI